MADRNTDGSDDGGESSGVTETHLIIIGSVCAVVIVSLLIVLFVVLCRRKKRNNKEYESAATSQPPANLTNTQSSNTKPVVGFVNQGDQVKTGLPVPERTNGNVPLDTSYDSQLERRMFENEMNSRNESLSSDPPGYDHRPTGFTRPLSPSQNKFLDLNSQEMKESSSGHDSGYSTTDTGHKPPKKVIYEVIV